MMQTKHLLFLMLLTWNPPHLVSAGQSDSLRSLLQKMPESKKKVEVLHRLFFLGIDQNIDQASIDAQEAVKIAKDINDPESKAIALTDLGYVSFLQQNYKEAILHFHQAILAVEGNPTNNYPFITYVHLSDYYRDVGRLDSANYYINYAQQKLGTVSAAAQIQYHQSKGWLDYQNSKYQDAIENAKLKMELSGKMDARSNLLLALSYIPLEEYELASQSLTNAFEEHRNNPDSLSSRNYILLLIAKGDLYKASSNYNNAFLCYEKAYDLCIKRNFVRIQARAASHLGHLFESFGNYAQAIDLYEDAMDIYEQSNSLHEIARLNARIAWALVYSDNIILSVQYAERSLSQMRLVHDPAGMSFAWNLLGYINYLRKDFEEAMIYYDSALAIRKSMDAKADYYNTIYNIAEVHEQYGELDKALAELKIVTDQEERNSKDINNLIYSYNTISRIYKKKENFREAERYALLAYQKAKEYKLFPQLKTSLENILDYKINVSSNADISKYHQELKRVNDTLTILEQSNKILKITALRELESRQGELNTLRIQAKLEAIELDRKNQTLTLYFYLIVLLIFSLLLLIYILYMRKQNHKNLMMANKNLELKVDERTRQLSNAYHELETYFYKSHHDMRGPVTTLLGLVSLGKISEDKNEIEKIWGLVEKTAYQQMTLIDKINQLDEVLSREFNSQLISLTKEIKVILERKKSIIEANNIEVSLDLNADMIKTSPHLLRIILENLVDNAIAYSNTHNPTIRIESAFENGTLDIRIIDNGQGIQEEIRERVFTMFFRGSIISDGSGLSLYTVKKAVEKIGGDITFESIPFERTIFRVQLHT
ncbi:MAG: tetratricopeptide repeat protein [Cyclobacteriaceae bacterium]|nr:tetratricopeptide repeat protein [Cyclobacteriaceae bacterium]